MSKQSEAALAEVAESSVGLRSTAYPMGSRFCGVRKPGRPGFGNEHSWRCIQALAAELLPLARSRRSRAWAWPFGLGNRDVLAGEGNMLQLMFRVSHGSFGRQQLDNMIGCLSNDSPVVPTAFGLSRKCSCVFARGIHRYLFGHRERRRQVPGVCRAPVWIVVGLTGFLPHGQGVGPARTPSRVHR